MNNDIPQIMPGADVFYLPGSKTGVLVLHGIAASPHEVHWLGEYLHQRGLTVFGPRIVGHGANYRDLSRMRWQDWYLSALDGYKLLHATCDQVFLCGMSMGGLLSTLLALNYPVTGLILLATPFQLESENAMRMARYIRFFRRFLHMPDRSGFPDRLLEIQRSRGVPVIGRVRYDMWATQSVSELYRLMIFARQQLSELTLPTFLAYSEHDPTVPLSNLDYVRERISSAHVETLVVQEGGHILTQDHAHEKVFETVAKFILDTHHAD